MQHAEHNSVLVDVPGRSTTCGEEVDSRDHPLSLRRSGRCRDDTGTILGSYIDLFDVWSKNAARLMLRVPSAVPTRELECVVLVDILV